MPTRSSAGRVPEPYEFIKAHQHQFSVEMMCRLLEVTRSGYYEWLRNPVPKREQEDARLLRPIRASFVASQGVYGAPRVFLDLREAGATCRKHRVARLMWLNGLRALHGYGTRRWSARSTIHREPVLNAVLTAVRCRRPRGTLIHWDHGTQDGRDAWRRFYRTNHLEPSMSRPGNCWDNTAAESIFSSLKKERIKKHIYKTGELAIADASDCIESFYNPTRHHSHLGGMSPDPFEAAHKPRRRDVH